MPSDAPAQRRLPMTFIALYTKLDAALSWNSTGPTLGMRLSCNSVNVYTIAYRVQYTRVMYTCASLTRGSRRGCPCRCQRRGMPALCDKQEIVIGRLLTIYVGRAMAIFVCRSACRVWDNKVPRGRTLISGDEHPNLHKTLQCWISRGKCVLQKNRRSIRTAA